MNELRRKSEARLPAAAIRRAMRFANANAGLWAVGNGLVSTQLVIYLANDLGAAGLWVGLILAAPRFAGLMRLGVPALIAGLRRRKAVCIGAYIASAAVLSGVPLVAITLATGGPNVSTTTAFALLVTAWCVYHLLEYVGTVALWSWLGDLTPRRIRGRLLGARERWLLIGRIVGMAGSISVAWTWAQLVPNAPQWQPLALSAAAGAAMMLAAVAPLAAMAPASGAPSALPHAPWRSLVSALADPPYRRLLLASCWIAVVSGVTQSAQEIYPRRVIGLAYGGRLALQGLLRAGQSAIAPWMGRMADHFGNRPVMIVSQLVAATGMLFFIAATPERWWLLAGAFIVWIFYAGLNVGLDNVKLKLAPADNNAPYLAVYHTVSDLASGAAILFGSTLFDRLSAGGADALWLYAQLFFWGWVGRTLSVVFLARLIEPGARRLSEIVAGELDHEG